MLPVLIVLNFCCNKPNGNIRMWCKQHKSMDPSCNVSKVQMVMMWWKRVFLPSTLWAFYMPQTNWGLLLIMSIRFWPQRSHLLTSATSRITHHFTKLKSSHTTFFSITLSSLCSNGVTRSQSSRVSLGCDDWEIHILDGQLTNLQQLWDVIMSIWTKNSKVKFQELC